MMNTLYFFRALPGSGKSSVAQKMAESMNIDWYEADMYFYDDAGNYNFDVSKLYHAHKWCQERTESALSHGMSVIVSNTSTTEKEVDVYHDMAKRHGARFVSLIVENRHGGTSIHNVPQTSMDKMRQRFSIKL